MRKMTMLLAFLSLLFAGSSVQATGGADADLALALARVCVNEAGWSHPADCDMIWQTTRSHGTTSEDRLSWLRRHSNCVLGESAPPADAPGNCDWSWYLPTGDEAHPRWTATVPWTNYARAWARVRAHTRGLVAGRRPRGGWPCSQDPDTWGGPMDHERAARRGMTPLGCRDHARARPTLNEGYSYRSTTGGG